MTVCRFRVCGNDAVIATLNFVLGPFVFDALLVSANTPGTYNCNLIGFPAKLCRSLWRGSALKQFKFDWKQSKRRFITIKRFNDSLDEQDKDKRNKMINIKRQGRFQIDSKALQAAMSRIQ